MTQQNIAINKSSFTTRTMVMTGMMSAVATVIYYLDFPVPLMPGFIKLDFSNVISMLAGFSLGPIPGIIVCLIKNVIQLLLKLAVCAFNDDAVLVNHVVFLLHHDIINIATRSETGLGPCRLL